MDFVDQTVIQLSDDATRSALFDATSLEQILNAAYDTSIVPVNAPFAAEFTEFNLGYTDFHLTPTEGYFYTNGGMEPNRLSLQLSDIPGGEGLKADALWRGNIIARSAPEDSVITSVNAAWPALGNIDEAIIAADGALPADPVALEQRRRTELINQLKALLNDPQAFSATTLDNILNDLGVASVAELLENPTGIPGAVAVSFSPPTGAPPTAQHYPVVAALSIHDAGFSMRDLLLESKLLRQRMERAGIERPRAENLPIKQGVLVIWIVPISIFDDADWPGAEVGMNADQARVARRVRAGTWLAREGIGLVAVT